MQADFIWMDGELVPYEQATVHIINPTLHYGPGVFEGIRCYETPDGPAVFRLQDHLLRFFDSILVLGFGSLPYTLDELRTAVHRTIQVNGFVECYVRPLMFLKGPMGLNLDLSTPVVAIACWQWGPYLGAEAVERGARAMISSFTRMHRNASMTKAKISGQYTNSMLAKTLALRSGFDEAILLDQDGLVAEATGENLFMVRDGKVYTPQLANVLEGITRDSVMTLAGDLDLEVLEIPITRDHLYIADEVFICGTAAEITPIREIDFRKIGDGRRGPITKAIQDSFQKTVHGNGRRSAEWLDFVQVPVAEGSAKGV